MFCPYLLNAAYHRGVKTIKFSLLNAKPILVWFTAFIIFALAAGVLSWQGIHLSGDEPHYIMITQSLVEDGDFDLKNNMEEKTYFRYLPVELRFAVALPLRPAARTMRRPRQNARACASSRTQ